MAKSQNSTRKARIKKGKARGQSALQPSAHELIRHPHITASARLRFDCALCIKVTHPEYMPHEVMALVKQGQVQLDPIAPGQVGTLILDGFPYTMLGYYTFLEQDGAYEEGPKACSFHGAFYEFYQHKQAAILEMVNATGEDFEKARQATRELRENMAKTMAKRHKRRRSKKTRKT
jgi:hypothetical protein